MTTDLESVWTCVREGYAALIKYPTLREALPIAWRYQLSRLSIEHVPPVAHEQFKAWRAAMAQQVDAGKFREDVSDFEVQKIAAVCFYVCGVVALSLSHNLKWQDTAPETFANMMAALSPWGAALEPEIPQAPGTDLVN
jgi:hypothetical protein